MLPSSNREGTMLHEWHQLKLDQCATAKRMNYVIRYCRASRDCGARTISGCSQDLSKNRPSSKG